MEEKSYIKILQCERGAVKEEDYLKIYKRFLYRKASHTANPPTSTPKPVAG